MNVLHVRTQEIVWLYWKISSQSKFFDAVKTRNEKCSIDRVRSQWIKSCKAPKSNDAKERTYLSPVKKIQ